MTSEEVTDWFSSKDNMTAMLAEIAYQLAVFNEREAARDEQSKGKYRSAE